MKNSSRHEKAFIMEVAGREGVREALCGEELWIGNRAVVLEL